jgi:hypothetical protein
MPEKFVLTSTISAFA